MFRLLALLAGLNLIVLAIIGFALYRSSLQTRQQATLVAENVSRVLEENLSRFFDKIDLTLLAVVDEVERQERAGGIDRATLEAFMARHDQRLPEALGLRVVNAKGKIEYAVSNVVQGNADVSDREHFLRHRDNPEAGLVITKPIIGRLNPQPMIIAARRRTGPDGAFAGIVHVAISVASLQRMFAAVDLGEHGAVALWDEGFNLVARHASTEGGPLVPSDSLQALIRGGQSHATYHARSHLDGIERLYAFRKIGRLPLFMVVGVADQDYQANWWREARFLAALAGMFALASAAAALAIGRGMWALDGARSEAEAARRRSDLVLASAGEGICGLDADGRVMFANHTARRLLGWGEDEGLGWDFHQAVHHHYADGSDYPAADCPANQMLATRSAETRQVEGEVYWRRDGTSFPVEYTVAPLIEGGVLKGCVNVFRDVSERLRIEHERARTLAVTEALAAILRLSLEDMSLEDMLDAALGELLALPWLRLDSQACIFLLEEDGLSLRMAAGRNLAEEVRQRCARVAVGHCLCGRAAATGMVVFAADVDDRHMNSFDGMPDHGHYCVPIGTASARLGVLNTYVAAGHPRDGEEERFLTMVADTLAGIIQRKRTEATLGLSEERANALLNAPADAAFLMDPQGIILAGNDAFAGRFGRSMDELAGRQFFELIPPELAARRRVGFDRVVATGTPQELRDERDGRSLDNRLYPVLDAQGRVAQVAVFSRDITEQQRAAKAMDKALADLARSNEELQQFAYVASHDLRQPLRMVSSYLGLIERRLGPQLSGEIKEFMAFAMDGAKRMDRLIVDLLDYSRAGRGSAPFAPVSLERVVSDALLNLQVALEETGAAVEVADGLPTVLGDTSELTRLFQNLIGNALKYRAADRRPRVNVGFRQEPAELVLWVQDNGIGMAAEDHERAFRVFQRLVPNDSCEGTGIGLAVCRKIIDHHQGRIWIESVLGEGCTFFVALPHAI